MQGVLVHRDIAPWLYDLKLSEAQRDDGNTRPLAKMLDRIHALDDRPLDDRARPGASDAHRMPSFLADARRRFCVSRAFRHARDAASAPTSTPASSKTIGSAEYWNAQQSRWILVDAQMDAIQRKAFNLKFDPLEVPRDAVHHRGRRMAAVPLRAR